MAAPFLLSWLGLATSGSPQIRGRQPYSIVRNIPYVILFLATDATQPDVGFCPQEKGRSAAHRLRAEAVVILGKGTPKLSQKYHARTVNFDCGGDALMSYDF